MATLPTIDFETFSAAGYSVDPSTSKVVGVGPGGKGGLPVVGAPVYAEHPTTEILCLCYDLRRGEGVQLWAPGRPHPDDLFAHIAQGGLVEAHNAQFEYYVWTLCAVRRYGFPPLPLAQLRCSKAKAKRFSLPGALGALAAVLGTAAKDKAGEALIRRLSVPVTPTKAHPTYRRTVLDSWDDFLALYDYCKQDVVAEVDASSRIPDLTPFELAVWQIDQTINTRGVMVDTVTLDAALALLAEETRAAHSRLAEITSGAVTTPSQNARFIAWINAQGVRVDSLDEDHRDALLARTDLPPVVRSALEIAALTTSANVKKLHTLRLQVSADGRLRDQYVYCGADRTGRWSAGGVQLQNITAKGPETGKCSECGRHCGARHVACPRAGCGGTIARSEWSPEAVDRAIDDIRGGNHANLTLYWGPVVPVLVGCLRGLFVAGPGRKLVCCDFSAIEAVAAACIARCKWRIEVFSTHGKIYEASAAKATGIPFEEILDYKKRTGHHHPARKGVGKIRELAGGYGGWVNAWKNFGADEYFADDEAIKQDVLKWREESPEIVEAWGGQYRWVGPGRWDYAPELFGFEGCAIKAILHPGETFAHNDVSYTVANDILYCRLPSGRFLYYHRPRLASAEDKLGRGPAFKITFEGYNSNAQKGPIGWGRWETYGGRLFENVVQAVSCDIQAEALLRLEAAGYAVVMHTHDEATAEVPDRPEYNAKAMAEIMAQRPSWASWWPLRADGWEGYRYRKD